MEILFDEDMVKVAINNSASKAIETAFAGYETQHAIASIITTEIAEGSIKQAIAQATTQIDLDEFTSTLAKELQDAVVKATIRVLREGLCSTICKLRGIGDYQKEERAKLYAELFLVENSAK